MRKICMILTVLTMLFVSMTSLFAAIDAKHIPDMINADNFAKFRLDRLEAVGLVSEKYDVKIGASILDIDSSFFNNNYAVSSTSLKSDGDIDYSATPNSQSFMFPQKMFVGFSMNINDVGFGFGYQFAYSRLTLGDLSLSDTQTDIYSDDVSDLVSDRMITSHTLSFGMVLNDGAIEFNVPVSFTAANKDYYSTVFTESTDSGTRATPEGNTAFSMLPSFTYNTSGRAFTYITTTFGFGMNKGTDIIDSEYKQGYALGFSLEVELGLQVITDPINILIQPDIYMAFGVNSDSESAAIDARYASAHTIQYSKGNDPILAYINIPVQFSSSIGNAITLYATPQLGMFYSKDGVTDIAVSYVAYKDTYGLMYGIEAGIGFAPIENLLFNFDIHAIGGPNYTLQSTDYVYIVGGEVVNDSDFTFGLNASLTWKF